MTLKRSVFSSGPGTIVIAILFAVVFGILASPRAFAFERSADAAWEQRLGVRFADLPLRDQLERFTRLYRLHYFLDRRVDPGIPVSLDVSDATVSEVFGNMARQAKLDLAFVGPVAYFGPPSAAEKLKACRFLIEEQIEALPPDAQRFFRRTYAFRSGKLETPREILLRLARREGLTLRNVERLPHDLWPPVEVSGVAFHDVLSFLLIGFNATYRIAPDGRHLTIGVIAEHVVDSVSARIPKIERPFEPNRPVTVGDRELRSPELSRVRFSGRVVHAKPSELLAKYARSLELRLEIDEAALREKGISLEQPVSFTLENATASRLFHNILDPLGCTHRISGDRLIVTAQ